MRKSPGRHKVTLKSGKTFWRAVGTARLGKNNWTSNKGNSDPWMKKSVKRTRRVNVLKKLGKVSYGPLNPFKKTK